MKVLDCLTVKDMHNYIAYTSRSSCKIIVRYILFCSSHADALVILLVSLDSQVEEKYSNLKQALQLVLYLNMFFAGFGAFSSFLAWLVSDGGSLIHLLGHLTCAILLPTMASPVLEKMYNDINKDLQCDEIGTNEEGKGFNERVHGSLPTIPEAIRQSRLRGAACKE